jgi:hypothetical protein
MPVYANTRLRECSSCYVMWKGAKVARVLPENATGQHPIISNSMHIVLMTMTFHFSS